jgi:hypothetical protein
MRRGRRASGGGGFQETPGTVLARKSGADEVTAEGLSQHLRTRREIERDPEESV